MANIKYRYDKEDDVLMVFLGKGKIDDAQQSGNIISHLSAKGELLLLEILDASKKVWTRYKTTEDKYKKFVKINLENKWQELDGKELTGKSLEFD